MTRSDFENKRYDLSVTAGMNQRYHQQEQKKWWWWDTSAKIVTAIFAVLGLAFAIVSALVESHVPDGFGVFFALIAATAAIILNVVPFGRWESDSADLFRRWSDLREEVDCLEFDLGDGDPPPPLMHSLRNLEARTARICGAETAPNESRLMACLAAEERARGCHQEAARAA